MSRTVSLVWSILAIAASASAQDFDQRSQIVARAFGPLFPEESALPRIAARPDISRVPIRANVEGFDQAVAEAIRGLKNADANPKIAEYEKYWGYMKNSQLKNAGREERDLALTCFAKNLFLAADGTRCTVTASAARGTGGIIRYAKPVDANAGRFFDLGLSTAVGEIEKSDYIFVVIRNGAETGRTSKKDCTGSKQTVDIPEN